MANEAHLKILEQGVKAWNEWRIMNDRIIPDLRGANFIDKSLNGANLTSALLSGARSSGAYILGANLSGAFLDDAQFNETLLMGSNFGPSTIARVTNDGLNDRLLNAIETNGA